MGSETVDSWLSRIHLGQYTDVFEKGGYKFVSQCHGLDEEHLVKMGIFLAGHIKRILAHLPTDMMSNKNGTKPKSEKSGGGVPADHPYENLTNLENASGESGLGEKPPSLPPKGGSNVRKVQLSDLEKAQAAERPQPKPRKSLSRGSLTSTGSKSNESLSKVSTGSRSNDSSPSSEVKAKPIPKPRSRTPKQLDTLISLDGVTTEESSDHELPSYPPASERTPQPNIDLYTSVDKVRKPIAVVRNGPEARAAGKAAMTLPTSVSGSIFQPEDACSSKSPTDTESTPEDNTDDSGIYEQVWQMKTLPPKKPERQPSAEELINFETPKDIHRRFEFDNVPGDRASTVSFNMPPPMFDPPPLPSGQANDRKLPSLPPVPPRVLPSPTQSDHRTSFHSTFSGSGVNAFQGTDPFADFANECNRFNVEANFGAASSTSTQYQLSRGDMSRGFASPGQATESLYGGIQGGSAASSTQRPDSCVNLFDPLVSHKETASSGPPALVSELPQQQQQLPVLQACKNNPGASLTYGPFDPFGLETDNVYSEMLNPQDEKSEEGNSQSGSTFDPFNLNKAETGADENLYSEMDEDRPVSVVTEIKTSPRSEKFDPFGIQEDDVYQNVEVIHQQEQGASAPSPTSDTPSPRAPDLSSIPPSPYCKKRSPHHQPPSTHPGVYSLVDYPKPVDSDDSSDDDRTNGLDADSSELSAPAESRIPILQNTVASSSQSRRPRTRERSGYLMKQGGVQNNKGWRKRWVIFNGEDLRYYTDNKTCVSKKILPVSCMTNVVNDIRMEDSRKYRFKLVTSNRLFIFAADSLEEHHLWSSTLMEAIITYKQPHEGGIKQGGKMHSTDKEGFIKLEGKKNKCFFAIKKDNLCYYNNYEDYIQACPINEIQMKLASVKEVNKTRLQLSTHYSHFMLTFDTTPDMQQWKIAIEDAIAEGLADDTVMKKVMANSSNQWCADCKASKPHWAAINLGLVLCKKCAGIHREFGASISRVKSLRMDTKIWTPSLIGLLVTIGNENANNFWEFNMLPDWEISEESIPQQRKQHIENKYKLRKYCRPHLHQDNKQALNEELLKAVETDDVLKTMQILFSGAEILYYKAGHEDDTAYDLAKQAGKILQMEFLHQNGGDKSARFTDSPTFLEARLRSTVCHEGFLYKTGSNRKDFLRRWCQLEHGTLTYFLDDKTTTAKDSIEYDSMLGIHATSTEKYANSFELSTTRQGNRLFLFATDIVEDRLSWLHALAKSFCPMCLMERIEKYDFTYAGFAYIREGITQEWSKSWLMLCGKILYYTFELIQPDNLQEVDLRKVHHVRLQESSTNEVCLEHGPCLVLDLPGMSLYIQVDLHRDTDKLHATLQHVSSSESLSLEGQQLTPSNVPVIVDKCINYIEMHGITVEGVYRLSGTHSKVAALLEAFRKDARAVILRSEEHPIHEVANCLKRYFRSLDDPLFTKKLYSQWMEKAAITDQSTKLQWYQYLLSQLPLVNQITLKKVILHLVNVSQHETENKMGVSQIASIFGPALTTLDTDVTPVGQGGFGFTNREISLMMDMMQFSTCLFELDKSELEAKQKMEKAMEKLKALSARPASTVDSGFIMGVYVDSPHGDCVTLQVTMTMSVEELVDKAKEKKGLQGEWALHECVCEGMLERPLNGKDRVFNVTLEWQNWDEEYRKGVCLCLKVADFVQTMHSLYEFHSPLFGELRFSEKRSYKKYCFEFKQSKLTCYKDARANNTIGEWEVEKLSLFHGVEKKRNPPSENGFTFIVRGEKMKKSRDTPYFGRSVCCSSRDETMNWMAGMFKAQEMIKRA